MNVHSSMISTASDSQSAEARVSHYDWKKLSQDLSGYGCAVIENLLSPHECRRSPRSISRKTISAAIFA
jgi:hypothetical protein